MRFDAYDVSQQIIRALRGVLPTVAQNDPKQADQLRRAANAVAANVREGNGRKGRDRKHQFSIAYSEAGEINAHLDSGVSWGYLDESRLTELRALIDRERAMLWRLSRG